MRQTLATLLARERALIARIMRDEAWYEGERRRCYVPMNDPIVQARVAEILLAGTGAHLRHEIDPESTTQNDPAAVDAMRSKLES